MRQNKKVHPVYTILDHSNPGGKETIVIDGESYFDRCVREFTAAQLSNNAAFELTDESIVQKSIQISLEIERQLNILTEVKKG